MGFRCDVQLLLKTLVATIKSCDCIFVQCVNSCVGNFNCTISELEVVHNIISMEYRVNA